MANVGGEVALSVTGGDTDPNCIPSADHNNRKTVSASSGARELFFYKNYIIILLYREISNGSQSLMSFLWEWWYRN